ncbi:TauD/TfdA family dioxygenase [Legionella sp.]|uniref:TauD/TfdA family dioxygenase n=1 Tax=Legionella sp. TaxID=459 RepID=UPI003C83FCEF
MSLNPIMVSELNLPMVLVSANHDHTDTKPLLTLIAKHRAELIAQITQYGAILFRGFSCEDESYFSQAIALCDLGNRCDTSDYDLPRTVLQNDIYTSSDLPPHIPLPLHHEKPRSKNPPDTIYFCCVTPAQKGGGTIVANAESIWQDMPQTIQTKIKEYGVVYKQFFHGKTIKYKLLQKIWGIGSARSWFEYFTTDEKNEIEKKLIQDKLGWEWINKGKELIVSTYLPGALDHPLTHKTNWFNSAAYLNYYANFLYGKLTDLPIHRYLTARYMILKDIFPMVCHYGNGQAFSADEVKEINRIIQKHTRVIRWQKGDFMIVDNLTFMHGKQPHEGNRLLYSCMTKREADKN